MADLNHNRQAFAVSGSTGSHPSEAVKTATTASGGSVTPMGEKAKKINKYALASATLASMASVVSGYDVAVMSGAALFIKSDLNVSDSQLQILAGIINLYSLVGSALAGRTSDLLGRRYTFVLAQAIFFAGALTMGLAPSYAILMVGRFVAGVGVGYAFMIAPVYTAEVSPAAARGFLTSFPEVFINFGILLGYISNYAFADLPQHINWRVMFCIGAVPPVFLATAVLLWMPESPRWLVMRGRLGEARRVLLRTCSSTEEVEDRIAGIVEAAGIVVPASHGAGSLDEVIEVPKKQRRGEGVWRDLLLHPTPSVRRILIAALGLQFFQQASGIDSVVLYSPRVFDKAGIKSTTHALGATMAVGFTKTAFILVATFFLDRVGRRPLLLTSTGGMIFSLLALGSGLTVLDRHPGSSPRFLVALCITTALSFVASFSIGLGPIAWVYTSEIFPLRLRAQGAALGTAMNRAMSGAIAMSFLSLSKAVTIGGAFLLYAGVATVGWLFFYFFLPETRGRSLEDIEVVFEKKKKHTAVAAAADAKPKAAQAADAKPTKAADAKPKEGTPADAKST